MEIITNKKKSKTKRLKIYMGGYDNVEDDEEWG